MLEIREDSRQIIRDVKVRLTDQVQNAIGRTVLEQAEITAGPRRARPSLVFGKKSGDEVLEKFALRRSKRSDCHFFANSFGSLVVERPKRLRDAPDGTEQRALGHEPRIAGWPRCKVDGWRTTGHDKEFATA